MRYGQSPESMGAIALSEPIKALIVNYALEQTGFGQAARGYTLALDTVLDIICRPIVLNNSATPEGRILELVNKPNQECRICIQHLLPHHLDYSGQFDKNIALFVTETKGLQSHTWISRLNLMDEVWVPNSDMAKQAAYNGITPPVKVLPHAFNIEEYQSQYDKVELPLGFNFYFIGESIQRKNIGGLVRAFHLAFTPNEPVNLIIKTNANIKEYLDGIKSQMKLYRNVSDYKQEYIISDRVSREDILRLHESCDCYVSASYGEGWEIGAFEAMAFGNSVIMPNQGAAKDYLQDYTHGYLVNGRWEPCFGAMDGFADLWTSREQWFSVDLIALARSMREAYVCHTKDRIDGLAQAQRYSYENIGQIAKQLL